MWYFELFGSIGLLFRYWVMNIKLPDILQHRIWHLSRILSYFFFISMLTNFENNIFTLIVIGAYPTMIAAFFAFDVSFYLGLSKKNWIHQLQKNGNAEIAEKDIKPYTRLWLLLERLTIHIPIIIVGTYFYLKIGVKDFFMPKLSIMTILIAFFFIMIILLNGDPRWTEKEEDGRRMEWPAGLYILIGAVLESIFLLLYFYIDFN